MSGHRWTTRSLVSATVLALLLGIGGTAIAYDARLDLASQNLEKARLLLHAADDIPQLDAKKEMKYSKALQRAVDAIVEAEERVQEAAVVADSP